MSIGATGLAAVLAFGLLGGASAQDPEPEPPPDPPVESTTTPGSLTVTGNAVASVTPDEATIWITVSSLKPSAVAAHAAANTSTVSVLSSLMQAGLTTDDLKTTGISLYAEYDYTETGRVLRGFRFSNSLLITVTDMDQVGEILDLIIIAGGDDVAIDNIGFTVSNRAEIEDEVRLAAIDNALAKAAAMAERAGVTLGRAITITESGGATPVFFEAPAMEERAFATPVFSGSQEVQVSVYIEFEIH